MRASARRRLAGLSQWRSAWRLLRSGLFDAGYYAAAYPDVSPRPWRGALHYVRHGAVEGRDPNAYFRTRWYLDRYQDVQATGLNPLEHYLLFGADEGRDPSPLFVTSWYTARNEDTNSWPNPLTHFLRVGLHEGRQPRRATTAPADSRRAVAPAAEEWESVGGRTATNADVVVVVPAYRGQAETLRCLYSVLTAAAQTEFRLLVVDDASPEPELSEALSRLSEAGAFDLVRNQRNLGFVAAANRGIRLASGSDVVLLNSDTEVYDGWLDRLRAAASSAPRIGTVTPLTGNGQIAGYPLPGRDNPSLELPDDQLDALAARKLAGVTVDLPTCVGFCTYIRRACIDEVGLLDQEAFGFGYGEENDFSLRASAAGWRHVLATDVFVRHYGGTSFGGRAGQLQRAGLDVLRRRYPGYSDLIAEHVARDPALEPRRWLDLARLQQRRSGSPSVLLVTHALGGGTQRHVEDLARRLWTQGVLPLVLQPATAGRELRLSSPVAGSTPNLRFLAGELGGASLVDVLRSLEVGLVHLHHLQGFGEDGAGLVTNLVAALDVELDVTVHDWMALCPRIDMVDGTGRYCGGAESEKCRACIAKNGSPFGQVDVLAWHERHLDLLARARRIVVPTADGAARLAQLSRELPVEVRPHPELEPEESLCVPQHPSDHRKHVALLGALGLNKGSRMLLAMAQDVQRRSLPLAFHVFGYTDVDAALRRTGVVTISGRYEAGELPDLVGASGCRMALFTSVTPETYSYALSEAWDLGLFPVCFDLGALATRIREEGHGEVLPWSMVQQPEAVNDALLALTVEPPHRRRRVEVHDVVHEYYGVDLPPTRSS